MDNLLSAFFSAQVGRLPLGDASRLFSRWRDTTNAERMNYWLSVLSENAMLVAARISPAPHR